MMVCRERSLSPERLVPRRVGISVECRVMNAEQRRVDDVPLQQFVNTDPVAAITPNWPLVAVLLQARATLPNKLCSVGHASTGSPPAAVCGASQVSAESNAFSHPTTIPARLADVVVSRGLFMIEPRRAGGIHAAATDQTTFGEGFGNCFSACVACRFFELPTTEEVPVFRADELGGSRASSNGSRAKPLRRLSKHRGRAVRPSAYHDPQRQITAANFIWWSPRRR